ncbi:MAG: hypothetical protein QM784_40400 [Polyangiaceae bacterium]
MKGIMSDHISLMGIEEASPDEAYDRILPEALKLDASLIQPVNLDVNNIVIIGMAAAKRLPAFDEALRTLTGFPAERLDLFADYTLALYSAQLRYAYATSPMEKLPQLNETATRWRDILLAEAKSLVTRQTIKEELLKELAGNHGYRNVAHDLAGLAQIFKANWEAVKDQTGLKQAQIEEVDKLALKLTGAVAQREQSPEQVEAATDIRNRIFTLFCRAYDEIRSGIQYLRRNHDDADEIVPSLYSGRNNSNIVKKDKDKPTTPAGTTQIGTTSNPAALTADTANALPGTAAGGARVPIGLPGGDPMSN